MRRRPVTPYAVCEHSAKGATKVSTPGTPCASGSPGHSKRIVALRFAPVVNLAAGVGAEVSGMAVVMGLRGCGDGMADQFERSRIHFRADGPLHGGEGDHNPGSLFGAQDVALEAHQSPMLDAHLLAGGEVGAGFCFGETHDVTDTLNFLFRDGDGVAARSRSEERRVGKECRSRWWPY